MCAEFAESQMLARNSSSRVIFSFYTLVKGTRRSNDKDFLPLPQTCLGDYQDRKPQDEGTLHQIQCNLQSKSPWSGECKYTPLPKYKGIKPLLNAPEGLSRLLENQSSGTSHPTAASKCHFRCHFPAVSQIKEAGVKEQLLDDVEKIQVKRRQKVSLPGSRDSVEQKAPCSSSWFVVLGDLIINITHLNCFC